MSSKQIHFQVLPKLFGVDSWIRQLIWLYYNTVNNKWKYCVFIRAFSVLPAALWTPVDCRIFSPIYFIQLGQVKTVLSCPVHVGDVITIGDKSRLFSVVLSILETEQFCSVLSAVANWKLGRDKTKLCWHCISRLDKTVWKFFCLQQFWLVANSVHTTDKTRLSWLVCIGGVNKA